jgi:acyl carrier protein phosphodiesterase
MNYLAHAYLSFGNPGIVVGNMISDFVKGKKKFDYPIGVQNGIALHRIIDTFTDTHPVTKEAAKIFKPVVGLYAGAFVDVAYDHFLATDDQEFSSENLAVFAQDTYQILYNHQNILPERFAAMLPYMKQQDWLYNYSTIDGTEKSFAGVARRAAYLNSSQLVFESFMVNYALLKQHYQSFFPDVKAFAFAQLANFEEK